MRPRDRVPFRFVDLSIILATARRFGYGRGSAKVWITDDPAGRSRNQIRNPNIEIRNNSEAVPAAASSDRRETRDGIETRRRSHAAAPEAGRTPSGSGSAAQGSLHCNRG